MTLTSDSYMRSVREARHFSDLRMAEHLRREHGWGIRRIARYLRRPERWVKEYVG